MSKQRAVVVANEERDEIQGTSPLPNSGTRKPCATSGLGLDRRVAQHQPHAFAHRDPKDQLLIATSIRRVMCLDEPCAMDESHHALLVAVLDRNPNQL
jgi:PIN domain nuclease of toxin-antitoxin system